jgi:hypothetical protein
MPDEQDAHNEHQEFTAALIDSLQRQRHTHKQKAGACAPPRAAHPGIVEVLVEHLGCTKERYSNALTAHSPEHEYDTCFHATETSAW